MTQPAMERWIAVMDAAAHPIGTPPIVSTPSEWDSGIDEDAEFATEAEAIAYAKQRVADSEYPDESWTVYRVQAVANVARPVSAPRVTRLDGRKASK